MTIHETALISEKAKLHKDVRIGPYCTVGDNVTLLEGVQLLSHVVVTGTTTIGPGCTIYPFASVGNHPQHLSYKGEDTRLTIGAHTTIREHATLHTGTVAGGGLTSIGESCFIMAGCHIAHDCQIGSHVVMANNATLGGHVRIGDYAIIGGMTAVHQFVTIGEYAIAGGASGIAGDLIPFGAARGNHAFLEGINIRGLKRHGFAHEEIRALWDLYHTVFTKSTAKTLEERLTVLSHETMLFPSTRRLKEFLLAPRSRPLCQAIVPNTTFDEAHQQTYV